MEGHDNAPCAPSVYEDLVTRYLNAHDYDRAFTVLVERHQSALYRFCGHMLGDDPAAEDAVQDVWVKAYMGISTFRREASIKNWLYTIAYNHCRQEIRKKKSRDVLYKLYFRFIWHNGHCAVSSSPEQQHIPEPAPEQVEQRVRNALKTLKPEARALLSLKYLQGLPYKDIEPILGKSERTLQRYLPHARESFIAAYDKNL
jgi:RNA polymerase sigma-70 factor (ECF subfamily)